MKLVWFNFILTAAFVCGELCKPGEVNYGRSCYELLLKKMNWQDGLQECSKKGGGLAIPDTLEENGFIRETFIEKADSRIWIGCKYQDGNWVQLVKDGHNCSYYKWKSNILEPNFSEFEYCVVIRKLHDSWNNVRCSKGSSVVCERSIAPQTYCLAADATGRFTSSCLNDHVIKELPIKGVLACGSACRAEPGCLSFNVRRASSRDGKQTCQLSGKRRQDVTEDRLSDQSNCHSFEI